MSVQNDCAGGLVLDDSPQLKGSPSKGPDVEYVGAVLATILLKGRDKVQTHFFDWVATHDRPTGRGKRGGG